MTIAPDTLPEIPEAEVLREDNGYHAFCGLTCTGWLYQKMKDSFFLILGTHTCSHLMQNALGVMIFAKPRFGVAMVEESDLSAAQIDITDIVKNIVEEHNPSIIFLLNSCTPEIMKVDFEAMARRLNQQFNNVPVLPVRADGLEYTMTQSEDCVIESLLQFCPVAPAGDKRIVFMGAVNDVNTTDLKREAEKLGLPVAGFVPSNTIGELPAIGPDTILAPLHPYVAKSIAHFSRIRGAKVLQSQFPIGPDGSRVFFEDLGRMFGKEINLAEREAEIWRNLESKVSAIRGKRIFFTGDNMLELPIARFLRKCGAELIEVGTPYVNRKFHKRELQALNGLRVVEMPNMHRQIRDIRELKPDLVVTNFWQANPFEAEGIATKWSTEIIFTPIYGFTGASDLANLFARALNRHRKLDVLDWKEFLPNNREN
ncbi:ferredoxin:protochlorophyllide reductase (ATP-dependent) subunit N [Candidatus Chlorohelix sp.]|uniref:ferredoxin:protochlorophyllide reductase (ATP-dependent) subunit N n=1 Tax=Candidatus Chlorohelix sp. TaxID=3139201 RepID=UPI003063278C